MAEYIKTAGALRAAVAHLSDAEPIEWFLNGVETQVYREQPGENGGDLATFTVEPNYTCPAPSTAA